MCHMELKLFFEGPIILNDNTWKSKPRERLYFHCVSGSNSTIMTNPNFFSIYFHDVAAILATLPPGPGQLAEILVCKLQPLKYK